MVRPENLKNHFNAISKPLDLQRISGLFLARTVAKSLRLRSRKPGSVTNQALGVATGNMCIPSVSAR